MLYKNREINEGLAFFYLSMLAFAGLGLEALLAFLVEPLIYGKTLMSFLL